MTAANAAPSLRELRKKAKDWERTAKRVYNYRRDVLPQVELHKLQEARGELKGAVKEERPDTQRIERAILHLEDLLRQIGNVYYPRSGWAENIETLLVAGILALGIRAYFLQPFSIPTNSMYPTYNGMTYEIFPDEQPNPVVSLARLATLGAFREEVTAPVAGEVSILIQTERETLFPNGQMVNGRNLFIFPAPKKQFIFVVGDEAVPIQVPADFEFWKVVRDRFFPEDDKGVGSDWLQETMRNKRFERKPFGVVLPLNMTVEAGETILAFDILTGDKLFVDRMSYHFVTPQIGDPVVFETIKAPTIQQYTREQAQQSARAQGFTLSQADLAQIRDDKFYIKRLVGWEGDDLRIEDPVLLRNGEPIEGAEAFAANHDRSGEYEGYTRQGQDIRFGVTVPEYHAYMMGDNSDESQDSRYFGPVLQKAIVGRALFLYYPFGKRWGLAE